MKMDVNNGFPVFDLHLVEHRVTQDSGGIDHRVKTAERRQRSIAHAFDSGIVGNAVAVCDRPATLVDDFRSEEHTSELQSLMRISYAVFCLKKKTADNIMLTLFVIKH